jgi:hypothetical protein
MILTFDNKFDQIDEADCMFYGMNKGKAFISCVLYPNGYVNVNE